MTVGQYAEHLVRKGISTIMYYHQFHANGDTLGEKVTSSLVRYGIKSASNIRLGARIKIDPIQLAAEEDQRWEQIVTMYQGAAKTSGTTFLITSQLNEFIRDAAKQLHKPMSLVFLTYLQLGLAVLVWRGGRSEDLPRKDIERIDQILDDIYMSEAELEFTGRGLEVYIVKKKASPKIPHGEAIKMIKDGPLARPRINANRDRQKQPPKPRGQGGYQ